MCAWHLMCAWPDVCLALDARGRWWLYLVAVIVPAKVALEALQGSSSQPRLDAPDKEGEQQTGSSTGDLLAPSSSPGGGPGQAGQVHVQAGFRPLKAGDAALAAMGGVSGFASGGLQEKLRIVHMETPYHNQKLRIAHMETPYHKQKLRIAHMETPYHNQKLRIVHMETPYHNQKLRIVHMETPYHNQKLRIVHMETPYHNQKLRIVHMETPYHNQKLRIVHMETPYHNHPERRARPQKAAHCSHGCTITTTNNDMHAAACTRVRQCGHCWGTCACGCACMHVLLFISSFHFALLHVWCMLASALALTGYLV